MIRFERRDDGLRIVDPVERRQFDVDTDGAVDPASIDPREFRFPVDGAAAVETARLSAPVVAGFVRDGSDERIATVEPGTDAELPADAYSVELNAPVKVYLRVDGPLVVDVGRERLTLSFEGSREVRIGARSYHEQPAATITVPAEPTALHRALPALASSLKTTSCERSFPTLRGHPPLLAVGDRLSIPDHLEPPETGVTLELPAEYRSLFVAAPLAYYLGSDVRRASEPRLVTDQGFERALDGPAGFELTVQQVLEQVFLLDCVTRTEGIYPVDLAERRALESTLDLDFAALYGRPPGRQLASYLSVPHEAVADHVPRWALTAHVPAAPESTAVLPYVLDDLGLVRTARARRLSSVDVRSRILDQYAGVTRGGQDEDRSTADREDIVAPRTTGSMEEAWFGEGIPLGATRATLSAFRNRLAGGPSDGPTSVAVVCNDRDMLAERDAASRTYGARSDRPLDVSIHEAVSTAAFADLLASDLDFLHYVGHVDAAGFECSDGFLDAEDLSSVGVRAFLLNACQSYRQGLALIDGGSVGGVVTLDAVADDGALTIGRTVARLLDLGFPLRAALSIAREESVVGGHYIVVGDGSVDVAQDGTGIPILCDAAASGDGYDVTVEAHLPPEGGMGSIAYPLLGESEQHFLAPGELGQIHVAAGELADVLDREWCPVRIDGDLLLPGDDPRDALGRAPGSSDGYGP